jgi:hypothetical protein
MEIYLAAGSHTLTIRGRESGARVDWLRPIFIREGELIPGDLNGDNKVDIFDYTFFLSDFGKTGSSLLGDLNSDGRVDIFDYSIFMVNFGRTS